MSVALKSMDTLEKRIMRAAENPVAVSLSNLKDIGIYQFRRSASYLCAAVVRMITKDHENLLRGWGYIQRQYQKFYEEEWESAWILIGNV